MAGARKLVIEILGNARDASKAFADVRKDSDKTAERLDRFGTAALGVGVAIAGGLAYAVTEFVAADEQSRKLDNSIRNSTQTFSRNGDAIRELATELQNLSGADGDALVGASSLAVQWGLSESQITNLLPVVNDLALKMGTDVDSAMKAVLKSTSGSSTALRKMGIDVDAAKMAADPFGATMEALQGSVGGFGAEVGNTAGGKLNILRQQLGDLVEAVGGGALDVFGPLINGLTTLTGASSQTSQSVGTFAGQFGVVAAGSLLAVGGLVKMKGAVDSAKDALTNGEGAINGYGRAAQGLAVVAALVPVFDLLAAGINDGSGRAQEMTDAWNRLKIALAGGESGARDVWSAFAEGVGAEQSTLRFQNLWQEFGAEIDLVGTGVKADVEQVQRAFDNLGQTQGPEAQRAALEQLERATANLPRNSEQYRTNTEFIERNRRSLELKTEASKADAGATEGATTALEEHADALRAQTDPIFAAMRATTQNADAKRKAADAQAKVTLLEAAGKRGSAEYALALQELSRANLDSTSSAVGQQGALATLAARMRDGTISSATFSQTLDGFVRSGLISQATADGMKNSFTGTAGAALTAAGGINGVKSKANELNGTTAHVRVTADTEQARASINLTTQKVLELIAAVNNRSLPRDVRASALGALASNTMGGAPGRSDGGTTKAGRPYLVGERGPEIVVPGSGYVVPTRRLIDAPTGGTSGGGVTVNVSTGVGDPVAIGREVVSALKAYERTSGTSWRS